MADAAVLRACLWGGPGWAGLVWSGLVCDDDNARSLHSRCGTGCAGQELDETMPLPWTGVCARVSRQA